MPDAADDKQEHFKKCFLLIFMGAGLQQKIYRKRGVIWKNKYGYCAQTRSNAGQHP